MTHQENNNLSSSTVEELTQNGLEAVPELVRVILNSVMQAERSQYLQAKVYERTEDRKGHANSYKPKTVRTKLGDITYIDTEVEKFAFLFLLMDLYSRFIVGYWVATSLAAEGAIDCLKMALGFQRETDHSLIHHSDHGVQYTSRLYMKVLFDHHVRPSMGHTGNCYDNIFAERLFGSLKNEYILGDRFVNAKQVYVAAKQSVSLYNSDQPHLSRKNVSPADVYFDQSVHLPPLFTPEEVT